MTNREYIENEVLIIVPCYQEGERLNNLKESLKKFDAGFPYKLSVQVGKIAAIEHWLHAIIENDNYRYIILMDDDVVIIQDNWLKDMIEVMTSNKYCGCVGVQIRRKDMSIDHCGVWLEPVCYPDTVGLKCKVINEKYNPDDRDIHSTYKVWQVAGCCALYDRQTFGMPPIRLYPRHGGWTDCGLQAQIWGNGFNVHYCGKVKVIHDTLTDAEKEKLYDGKPAMVSNNMMTYARMWNVI